MKSLSKKYRIARLVIFIIFLIICGILIGESLTPSKNSAAQSNKVGNIIAGFVNDFNGDQAIIIEPEAVVIKNKVTEAHPKDKLQLELETTPSNTRYKSYTYVSSNKNVATVNSEGIVEFLTEGSVTITAVNSYKNTITDSFTVTVSNILVEELDVEIPNADKVEDIYHLYLGQSYSIKSTISPSNTTNKTLSYEVVDNPYIKVSGGQIQVLQASDDNIISVHVKIDNVDKVIQIKTMAKPVVNIPVEAISLNTISGYEASTISLSSKVKFTPTTATNKTIEIVSIEDTSIAKVSSGVIIKLLSVGETKVTIRHKETSLEATATIKVLARPTLEDYSIKITGDSVLVNKQSKITIYNVTPKNASTIGATYTSSDSSILTVSSSGYVKGISVGSASVFVTINGIEKELPIEVKASEDDTTDFVVDYKVKEEPEILVDKAIKLSDYFGVSEFIPEPPHSDVIEFGIHSGNATISSGNLVAEDEGEIQVTMLHKTSGVSKIVKLIAVYELKITKSFDNTLYLNHESTLNIETNSIYPVVCELSKPYASVIVENGLIRLSPNRIGTFKLTVYPTMNSSKIESLKQEFTFTIAHVDTKNMDVHFKITPVSGDPITVDNPDDIKLFKNDKLTYTVSLDKGITRKLLLVESDNDSVIIIQNSKLAIVGIGSCKLTFKEEYSDITYQVSCSVYNKVLLNEKKSISVTGSYKFDADTNTITIVNGDSITIKYNFLKNTTIKDTKYESSDEEVAIIGNDGVLTPIELGEATITLTIEDETGVLVTNDFNIVVVKKDIIENLNDFLLKVRKGLGHFGAFLVLAVFGALSLFMYFSNRKWYHIVIKVSIIFAFGFGFAALTEYLQTLTPGRVGSMSDILVDFSGYSIGAGIISIIFIILLSLKIYKQYKKNKVE